jgi:hypothetical protein
MLTLRNAKLQLSAVLAPGDEVPGLYLHPDHRRRRVARGNLTPGPPGASGPLSISSVKADGSMPGSKGVFLTRTARR